MVLTLDSRRGVPAADYANLAAVQEARDKWEGRARDVTTGRAVIALRFDDGTSADNTTLLPLLQARSLPATWALNTGHLDTATYLTTAQALTAQTRGVEMAAHSRNHGTDPVTLAEFVDEVETANTELQAAGFNTAGFIQPGTWVALHNYTTAAKFESTYGRIFRKNFGWVMAYRADDLGVNFVKPYPAAVRYGAVSDIGGAQVDAQNLAGIDNVVKYGGRLVAFWHTAQLGNASQGNLANLTACLDKIKTYRDAGQLDVVPLSTVFLGRPGPAINMLPDGNGLLSVTGTLHPSWQVAGAPTVVAGGGVGGVNAFRVGNATNYVIAAFQGTGLRHVHVSGYAKSGSAGVSTTARVMIDCYDVSNTRISRYDTRNDSGQTALTVIDTALKFDYYGAMDSRTYRVEVLFMAGQASATVDYSVLAVQKLA